MKIQFNPKDILPKLKIAKAVAATRDVKSVMQNVKIVADKERGIILQATDTEQGIRIRVKCKVEEEGAALLPIKRLVDILGTTKASRMMLSSIEGGTLLEWDGEEYTFLTQSLDKFSDVSDFQTESYLEISAWVMQATIPRTVFAVDKQAERYALAGVCFQSDGVMLDATATDGCQLTWQSASGENIGDQSSRQGTA